jgi:4-aminobutyrate aminotransferase/(S)-3-amino-2-methylpropionate transaminase
VVRAGQRQMATLLHAMGDVHPHALKAQLAKELSELTFGRWASGQGKGEGKRQKAGRGGGHLCNSGFEAVEAALKTARLAIGEGRDHCVRGRISRPGLWRAQCHASGAFRGGFRDQLREFAQFVPFPKGSGKTSAPTLAKVEKNIRIAFAVGSVGAILVEPIQARGGINVPPAGFLPLLRRFGG